MSTRLPGAAHASDIETRDRIIAELRIDPRVFTCFGRYRRMRRDERSVFERSRLYKALRELGWGQQRIANVCGVERTIVVYATSADTGNGHRMKAIGSKSSVDDLAVARRS